MSERLGIGARRGNGLARLAGQWTEDEFRQFEIVVDLRQAGTPIPTNDIWIAATAARAGAIVLSYDDRFDAVARVGSTVLARP